MTKEELRGYRNLKREADQLEQYIARIKAEIYAPRTTHLDAIPGASPNGTGPTERLALKHVELLERYREKLVELRTAQLRIEKAIEPLSPDERMLMRYRYIDGLTWEEVAVKMGYSWRQVHRIHAKALEHVRE